MRSVTGRFTVVCEIVSGEGSEDFVDNDGFFRMRIMLFNLKNVAHLIFRF